MRGAVVTSHAVERYQERVKPTLTRTQANVELRALVEAAGEPTAQAPDWVHRPRRADAYLEVAPGVALTVQATSSGRQMIVTCLTRGEHAAEVRTANRKRARVKRNRKRDVRYFEKHSRDGHRKRARERSKWA